MKELRRDEAFEEMKRRDIFIAKVEFKTEPDCDLCYGRCCGYGNVVATSMTLVYESGRTEVFSFPEDDDPSIGNPEKKECSVFDTRVWQTPEPRHADDALLSFLADVPREAGFCGNVRGVIALYSETGGIVGTGIEMEWVAREKTWEFGRDVTITSQSEFDSPRLFR